MPLAYCQRCVLPNSRPNLSLDREGICTACRSSGAKPTIDWASRRRDFEELIARVRSKNAPYDCLVPVSGGKDSTWQILTCLEYGLKPLAVTWKTPCRTGIGAKNLANLISLGVDHIDFTVNPRIEKKFTGLAFKETGSPAVPMHMALFAIPLRLAVQMHIPLVIWGENSAVEYGGDDASLKGQTLNRAWLNRYGVTGGTSWEDWCEKGRYAASSFTLKDLAAYHLPSDHEMAQAGTQAVFLGHYFSWDPEDVYRKAEAHGFQKAAVAKTGLYDYADIDDEFLITLHHALKWYKFGFTRLWDNLSLEIRAGRISRDQAIQVIKDQPQVITEDVREKFCAYAEMSCLEFNAVLETFRSPAVWKRKNGVWSIPGFLIPDWNWENQP